MAEAKADSMAQTSAGLPYASLELRIVAFILDVVVLASSLMLFIAAAGLQLLIRSDFGDVDPPDSAFLTAVIIVLSFLAFVPLYYTLLIAWKGQTVGKMAVRIKVVRRDGGRLGLGRAMIRWLGYLASALPLGMGFFMALMDGQRRTLHDLLAGSVVIELP